MGCNAAAILYKLIFFSTLMSMVFTSPGPAQAAEDAAKTEILLGQSCALSGPAKNLGEEMRAGLLAAFSAINDAGGIDGRKIRLISRDDGYEPRRAILNTRSLIEDDGVFLLIGEVGTPTSKAVLPIVEKTGVPFFGPFTGAGLLREPFKPLVINLRASYAQEMEALARYLVDRKGFDAVACLYQNDAYGQAGLSGIRAALKKRGLQLAATGDYERNTTAVKSALLKIRRARPRAVVMVGAYKPCAAFIRLARELGMTETVYCNISFVGARALADELGADGDGVVISQVAPFPADASVPIVKEYLDNMKTHAPDRRPGFVSLEGYMVGKLFGMAAADVEGELTRKGLVAAMETRQTYDLGGFGLTFGPRDHQGSDRVFLTVIRDGNVQPLEE